jgi:hypothetical protein
VDGFRVSKNMSPGGAASSSSILGFDGEKHRNLTVATQSKHRRVSAPYSPLSRLTGHGQSAVIPDIAGMLNNDKPEPKGSHFASCASRMLKAGREV